MILRERLKLRSKKGGTKMLKFLTESPELPQKFAPPEFNVSLFFDFSLRGSSEFHYELKNSLGLPSGFLVLSANGFRFLRDVPVDGDIPEAMRQVHLELWRENEYHGVCLLDSNARWIIAQHTDLTLGVAVFKTSDPVAVAFFEKFRASEWFFDTEYIASALNDRHSCLLQECSSEFLHTLLDNYSSDLPSASISLASSHCGQLPCEERGM